MGFWKKKKKASKPKEIKNILYDHDFSGKMIELEIYLESNKYDHKTLHNLVCLYQKAIKYFSMSSSDYVYFFKNKIKSIIIPCFLDIIDTTDQQKFETKKRFNFGLKLKELELKSKLIDNQNQEDYVKFFNKITEVNKKRNSILKDSLDQQNKEFIRKLKKRKSYAK